METKLIKINGKDFKIIHTNYYDPNDPSNPIKSIFYDGVEIRNEIISLIDPKNQPNATIIQFDPFNPFDCKIELANQIQDISKLVFQAIEKLSEDKSNGCLCCWTSTFFYDSFTPLWKLMINEGRQLLAVQLWIYLLKYAWDWENEGGCHIHKGSPYAFLARTLFICGDIDVGFTYLYNAIEEDIILNDEYCPELGYPESAPVYLTASLVDNPYNLIHSIVKNLRKVLNDYLQIFNKEFNNSLAIGDVDRKFLQNPNPELKTIKYFFVYNLWVISEMNVKLDIDLLNNKFSRLRILDLFFNFCLILDKLFESNPKYGADLIGNNVYDICDQKEWLKIPDHKKFRKSIRFLEDDLDTVIPKLLSSPTFNGAPVKKEVLYLLISLKLRNYQAHNITDQKILSSEYKKLLRILICVILLAVDELPEQE